jgi:ribonuclease HI
MDAPPTASQDDTLAIGELHYLAGNHHTEWGRDNCLKWRQRVASLIPAEQRSAPVPKQRGDRFARNQIQRTALSREEKNAEIKAEADRQLNGMSIGSLIAYTDGGADGNGANGDFGACGFGAVITRKQEDWTPDGQPTVEDCYFGPVVTDTSDAFWLGAKRGTNNTGELNGVATALLHMRAEGGHEPAAICYDSKYAANVTDRTWEAKSNVEAARINRDLYEAEHQRRSGGIIMIHVKGHSGDIGNDYADRFVQDGKGPGPYSRLRLSRSETSAEKRDRRSTLSALALPFELPTE